MEKSKIFYYGGIVILILMFILKFARRIFKEQLENIPFQNYAFAFLFSALGVFIIMAVHEQYDYFVMDGRYKFFKRIFGETGVKVFYYILGLGFIVLSVFMLR